VGKKERKPGKEKNEQNLFHSNRPSRSLRNWHEIKIMIQTKVIKGGGGGGGGCRGGKKKSIKNREMAKVGSLGCTTLPYLEPQQERKTI